MVFEGKKINSVPLKICLYVSYILVVYVYGHIIVCVCVVFFCFVFFYTYYISVNAFVLVSYHFCQLQ